MGKFVGSSKIHRRTERVSSKMRSLLLLLPIFSTSSSLSISFSPSKSDAKPLLGVVYESLCPYSRQFIREQVHPAYTSLSEFFDVEFVAYGGASTHGNAEDGYTFECQHGPRECAGNIVQGCTVHHVADMMTQVELLNCMSAASKPEEAGEECFAQFGADWAPVQACIDGPEGGAIHAKNGEIQGSLEPSPYGVPWPLWDGVGGDEVINETDRLGVIGYLCKYYYSDNLPGDVCA